MKFTYNTRLQKEQNFFSYQIVFEKILKITTKKKMKRKIQQVIETKQVLRKDIRENLVLEY